LAKNITKLNSLYFSAFDLAWSLTRCQQVINKSFVMGCNLYSL